MANYYYNGVLLPEIPTDGYLYHYIVSCYMPEDNYTAYYLYSTNEKVYAEPIVTFTSLTMATESTYKTHAFAEDEMETWEDFGENTDTIIVNLGLVGESLRHTYTLIWTNTDIPNGSADATEIYMYASEPTLPVDNTYSIKESTLKGIANSIRSKTGKTDSILTENMAREIEGISSGGGAELNIHYGDTAPEDTSKLWVKASEPNKVFVSRTVTASGECSKIETATSKIQGNYGCCASLGKKIYLFGGANTSGYSNIIEEFDTETETIRTLDSVLPDSMYGGHAVAVGSYIYILGGNNASGAKNTIYKFNPEIGEITTLETTLLQAIAYGAGIVAIGAKIYLVQGYTGSSGYSYIQIFDTQNGTISNSTSLSTEFFGVTAVAVGTNIYIFGGKTSSKTYNFVKKYDTLANTVTSLSDFSSTISYLGSGKVGNKIYLFRGSNLYLFDIETETYEQFASVLLISGTYAQFVTVGNTLYFMRNTDSTVCIYKYVVSMDVASDEMQIEPTLTSNLCYLLNDDIKVQIGISGVYKGNSENIGELVEAYLYKDGTWTAI